MARSFNRAAGHIEQLVQTKSLWPHIGMNGEPIGQNPMAVELMKDSWMRSARSIGTNIAELDWLVDEILLASRLDAVTDVAYEEVDLLALAAEECARYDEAQLRAHRTIRVTPACYDDWYGICWKTRGATARPRPQVRSPGRCLPRRLPSGRRPGLRRRSLSMCFRPFYRPANSQSLGSV